MQSQLPVAPLMGKRSRDEGARPSAPRKRIAIVQPNYLPWRGYFDLIGSVDGFILLNSVQYTRRDWRNRNVIKTPAGLQWITVPVQVKGKYLQLVDDTRVADPNWSKRHVHSIELSYRKAAAFAEVAPWLFELLVEAAKETLLSRLNERLLISIARRLGIRTPIWRCTELLERNSLISLDPTARLVALCQAASADCYVSGPAARPYLDERMFTQAGIKVIWMAYADYPEYPQLWGAFEPRVSIIDLLLNTGSQAGELVVRSRQALDLLSGR